MDKGKQLSETEIEREEECGICMEMNTKVVLPNCSHSLCMNCYKNCGLDLSHARFVEIA
ncbi:E3 ubiquitin-protein ligase airp2 [Orobanche gracilis]